MRSTKKVLSRKTFKLAQSQYMVLGVSSLAAPSNLAWFLNSEFDFHFAQSSDIFPTPDSFQQFEHYVAEDEDTLTLFRCIHNRNADGVLVREYRNLDYLFYLEGDYAAQWAQKLKITLRKHHQVFYVDCLPAFRLGKQIRDLLKIS